MQNPNPETLIRCAERRQRVLHNIGEDSIAVLFSAPVQTRSNDTTHPYRQDSYFHYLTAFPESQSILILDGKSQKSLLFCQEKNPELETWNGFLYGTQAAKSHFQIDEVANINDFPQHLSGCLKGHKTLYSLWALYPEQEQHLLNTWHSLRHSPNNIRLPENTCDLRTILDPMRLIKDTHECALLRQAAHISALGHIRAMKTVGTHQYEYQVEAELIYEFMQHGARSVAYENIVASGKNACTLHYTTNCASLEKNALLLIDAGAEYQNYAGDITRTFPVNGRFSPAQKAIYEIVLHANETIIATARHGIPYQQLSDLAIRTLTEGLISLKLLSGSLEENISQQTYRRFYMHGFGHWLGLDVHDVGGRFIDQKPIILKENMCLTVEPGLYIPDDADIPSEFRGIGVRIEDNIIIHQNHAENYTATAPKTIADIENLMHK